MFVRLMSSFGHANKSFIASTFSFSTAILIDVLLI